MYRVLFAAVLLLSAMSSARLMAQTPTDTPADPQKDSQKDGRTASVIIPGGNTLETATSPKSLAAPNGESPASPSDDSKPTSSADDASLTTIYRVGVGDVLDVRIRNLNGSASTLFTVLEGGIIDFPILGGSLSVGGKTTEEIQIQLANELKRRALVEGAQVNVAVRLYASHSIIITGLVVSGGTKILRREAVPLYVILAESQSRLDAARANIMRANNPVITVDLTDPASSSVLIRPGDVINITARPEVFYYIGGRINYPGQKVFQSGITLLQAILAAGGLRDHAEGVVEISRDSSAGNLTTTKYNLRDIKAGRVSDPRLQPGDRIEVLK